MLYKDTINSAQIQSSFLKIIAKARAIVDATVTEINNLNLIATETCKVTSRQTSRHVTRSKMCHHGMMEHVKNNEKYTIRYVINMQDLKMLTII